MNIRNATIEDIYDIYKISNDDTIRKASFNQQKIDLKEHKIWFSNKLKDKQCIYLVAIEKEQVVGQIRFDIIRNEANVSISMLNASRGKGLATQIMQEALSILKNNKPSINEIKANIRKENDISKSFFEKCNYHFSNKIMINGCDAYQYIYKYKNRNNYEI